MNTSPEKLFLFCSKTFVEPFSHFFEIAEVLLCKRMSHWYREEIVRRMSHPSDFKVSFVSFDVWDAALSCNKTTLPCLLAHSGCFPINAWFKLIIVDDSVVWVLMHAIPPLCIFVFHIEIAIFKSSKPCLTCFNRWSVFTIMILRANNDFPQLFLLQQTIRWAIYQLLRNCWSTALQARVPLMQWGDGQMTPA